MTEVIYLVTLICDNNHARTFATKGEWRQADQGPPWPDVICCPNCGIAYPDDMGVAMVEDREVEVVPNPEVHPEER